MNTDEKLWYSINEALIYLNIEEHTLYKKMLFLNIESRDLPGAKGQFLSKRDLDMIKLYIGKRDRHTD